MNWGSWSEFAAMGGYGLFVWGSYLVAAGVLATEVSLLALRRRNILRHLGRLHAPDEPSPGRPRDGGHA